MCLQDTKTFSWPRFKKTYPVYGQISHFLRLLQIQTNYHYMYIWSPWTVTMVKLRPVPYINFPEWKAKLFSVCSLPHKLRKLCWIFVDQALLCFLYVDNHNLWVFIFPVPSNLSVIYVTQWSWNISTLSRGNSEFSVKNLSGSNPSGHL